MNRAAKPAKDDGVDAMSLEDLREEVRSLRIQLKDAEDDRDDFEQQVDDLEDSLQEANREAEQEQMPARIEHLLIQWRSHSSSTDRADAISIIEQHAGKGARGMGESLGRLLRALD
jgi:septal ring factor EnvC (AmiA/AmiB activator)